MTEDAATAAGFPDPCVGCEPEALPREFAAGRLAVLTPSGCRAHVAARLGDGGRYRIMLEGEDVTDVSLEAVAGDPGIVLVVTGETHVDHPETLVRRGRVRVRPTS